jgi:hypothetical protein
VRIDRETAVFVCAGPSIDRITPEEWREIGHAGAVLSVNGALASRALLDSGVRLTYAAALDVGTGYKRHLQDKVPGLGQIWETTPAWRLTKEGEGKPEAESYITLELTGWTEDPTKGFAGGSTAMVVGNWICNDWTDADYIAAEEIRRTTGKIMPRRAFRKLAYFGLDMQLDNPVHAAGAGQHTSGFGDTPERWERVCNAWGRWHAGAVAHGVEVANLTVGTGLMTIPRDVLEVNDWVDDRWSMVQHHQP